MRRLKNQLHLTDSLATISKEAADADAAKKSIAAADAIDRAPAAVAKLTDKGGDLNKITMNEMSAIAYRWHTQPKPTCNACAHALARAHLRTHLPTLHPL